jgi:maltose O-acetyltransferase
VSDRRGVGGHLRSLLAVTLSAPFLVPKRLRVPLLRLAGMTIGRHNVIQYGSSFRTTDVRIGDGCYLQQEIFMGGLAPVRIGDRVYIGTRCHFETTTHDIGPAWQRCGQPRSHAIVVEDGAWLGSSTTVLPGVTIGAGCVVAAGSVVVRDCEPHGLYAGVPAVRKRDLDPR